MSEPSSSYSGLEEETEEIDDSYSIRKLCPIVCNNKRTYEFLVAKGVLKSTMRCSSKSCRRDMSIEPMEKLSDGAIWRCRSCRTLILTLYC